MYEVTFAQFDPYCEAAGVRCPEDEGWGRADRPVINVSWADTQAFIAWLNEHSGQNFRAAKRGGMGVRRKGRFGDGLAVGGRNAAGSGQLRPGMPG